MSSRMNIQKAKADAQAKITLFVALSKHCARVEAKTRAARRELREARIARDLALRDVMATEKNI